MTGLSRDHRTLDAGRLDTHLTGTGPGLDTRTDLRAAAAYRRAITARQPWAPDEKSTDQPDVAYTGKLAALFADELAADLTGPELAGEPISNDRWRMSIASIAQFSHPTVRGTTWNVVIGETTVAVCYTQAAAVAIVGALRLVAYQLWTAHRQLITDLIKPAEVASGAHTAPSYLLALESRIADLLLANATPDMFR